ncbi:MAG TPA: valine--tRNA ligase [Candidatus Aminicenantes bacterium]|nr:valine--tRNA ligase [Candidatus Aminicenantes bacterium]HRY64133.1 valine--tRNA ligase [Candidatus Aminicenantes bacterium]HRZ71046.1 valine--tRNA ligase [Candidatus Aminicenantes bacterium]
MSTKEELAKAYDPKPVEEKWGKFWIDEGLYVADAKSDKPKFSMVLPPANVTGILHMGHALCFTLPDIITRWKRMRGYNCLWLPGTDHASIAVHNVIEKKLAAEGKTRETVGREEFLRVAWEWKRKYAGVITSQLRKLGLSLDWSRERFTMDEGFSRAVNQVFVSLYDEGLIYRDYFLVNRCPRCRTVLSDIEIEHKDLHGKLWHIRYRVEGSDESVVVATTRPETMLGDTALAVHPDDERYAHLHGKRVILPLQERPIPVITDERVEREFGTGAVKVTPAHDPVDFELGKKHGLEQIIVIDGEGRMTEAAGPEFAGLDRFAARAKVVEALQAGGLLVKIEDHDHAVGHCYRCHSVIEPHLSWQWFVRIKTLADEAIRVVEDGSIEFVPPNWSKTYFEWMYNIHDWCISRQLWWGHRIPAWYCRDCGRVHVAMEAPARCAGCGGPLVQDEDVLDTWFSSALWPFGTLGWPEETEDLKTFYPTDLMSTGFDIIFFWVARMIMMGLKFRGQIPFRQVFINGLVRDLKRRKMSKSEGNIIDPLEMIDKYGTDALRFTLAALAVPGMDLALSEERMAGYQAFANKIWNASRFVLMNLEDGRPAAPAAPQAGLSLADRWIRSRLAAVTAALNESLDRYKFYEAADIVYHFVWHEFCDWYIEFAKVGLREGSAATEAVLADALDRILRLLHPFMPFITEEIWQHLPGAGKSISVAPFPAAEPGWADAAAEKTMALVQAVIVETRTVRAGNRIAPKDKLRLIVKSAGPEETAALQAQAALVKTLAGLESLEFAAVLPEGEGLLKGVAGPFEIGVVPPRPADAGKERERLQKDLAKAAAEIEKIERKLANADFVAKAPAEVVAENRARLEDLRTRRDKLGRNLAALGD